MGVTEQLLTNNTYEDEDAIDWGEDTSEEAQRRRIAEMSIAAANLALTADLEKTPQERADFFFEFVKVTEFVSPQGAFYLLILPL